MTLDDMAGRSSMARSTIGKSLSGTRASTVSELESLCKALNVRVSSIVHQAEEFVKSAPSPADLDALDYISITEAKLTRVLNRANLTPAAKPHQPDPDDHAGEESQTPVIEDTH